MRILVLYFPWVNDVKDASPTVPFVNDLWQTGLKDWKQALLNHATNVGFATDEVKRLVLNFVYTYCLPRQTRLINDLEDNSDNEELADDLFNLQLKESEMLEATLTHVRGGNRDNSNQVCVAETNANQRTAPGEQAPAPTRLYDMTMEMFNLSTSTWLTEDSAGNDAARQRHEKMLQSAAAFKIDHEQALQAAKQSNNAATIRESTGLIGEIGASVEVTCAGQLACSISDFHSTIAMNKPDLSLTQIDTAD